MAENKVLLAALNTLLRQPTDDFSSHAINDLPRDLTDAQPMVPTIDQRATRKNLTAARELLPKMEEAQAMCQHVLLRLFAIFHWISSASAPPPSDGVLDSFDALLAKYVAFLKEFANEKVVLRLVHNRIVVQQNLKYHNDIDNLLKGLQLPDDNEALKNWRPQWEACRDAQCAAFEAMSKTKKKLLEGLSRTDTHAQTEAITLLMFEYDKVTRTEYTDAELKVLKRAFTELAQFSGTKTPSIATWLLPPYQFERNETAFANGSFGNVYHGTYGGSEVAVKCAIIKDKADSDRIFAAFVKEANLWFKASKFPNVVHLYGAYNITKTPYFVCEYASNGTLKSYAVDPKNRHQIWKLLLDAANGLMALHQLRILHNDIKCDNFVVSSDGKAKITDFGLSCELPDPASETQLPVVKSYGALPWKAPELLAGTSSQSFASDTYSFGMCIIEAVSNSNPWDGWKDVMIKNLVKKGELPPRPAHVFEDDEWNLVTQMCAQNPEDRLTMAEAVEKLKIFENREGNRNIKRQQSFRPSMATLSESTSEDDVGASDASEETESPKLLSAEANTIVSPVASVTSQNDLQAEMETSTDSSDLPLPASSLEPPADTTSVPTVHEMPESTQESSSLSVTRPTSTPEDQQTLDLVPSGELPEIVVARSPDTSKGSVDLGSNEEIVDVSTGEPECELEPEHKPASPLSVTSATISRFRYVTLDRSRKQIVQYQVKLILANGETHTVWKRFSAFRNFRCGLRDEDGAQAAKSLPFPSRFALKGNLVRKTVENRKDELNVFLKKMFEPSCAVPFGVLMPDSTSYFKDGADADVLL